MSRARVIYDQGVGAPRGAVVGAIECGDPIAGFYRMRLRSGGVFVGIRVWYGPPLDPATGEELDRSYRWQATANGRPIDFDRVWPKCGGDPIDEAEHHYLSTLQDWAQQNAPSSPQANPHRKINMMTAPPPF